MAERAINKAINKQHASCLPPLSALEKGIVQETIDTGVLRRGTHLGKRKSPPWKQEIVQETIDADVLRRGYPA